MDVEYQASIQAGRRGAKASAAATATTATSTICGGRDEATVLLIR
jgi:hypothetical protein